ncbi:MAG: hypothetical protein HeimC3_40040 [Candidatus Heimdallarchaeota archaeon LC_3]|nr:MAG: hypothetical protein HeimC3_40040 [Candidatus Heimdallarchaeota archaeon LC_3]
MINKNPIIKYKTEHFTLLISYDHIEKKYLLIYAKKRSGGKTVRYITEEVSQAIKERKKSRKLFYNERLVKRSDEREFKDEIQENSIIDHSIFLS